MLISIIVPVYNVEKYLKNCIESILRQTFTDFEAIFINDGSTDNSQVILDEYVKLDKRFKLISQKNQGLSLARNAGLNVANGKYIYFLDSDDIIHPKLLETSIYFLEKYSADIICFDFEKISAKQDCLPVCDFDISSIPFIITKNPILTHKKIPVNVWTKLYKREFINGLSFIAHIQFEDVPFTYAVLSRRPKTIFIKEKLYFYTQNTTSISRQSGNVSQIQDYFTGIKEMVECYQNDELFSERKNIIKFLLPSLLKQQLNRCRRAPLKNRREMFSAFSQELRYLSAANWLKLSGNKLIRFLWYQYLIRKG